MQKIVIPPEPPPRRRRSSVVVVPVLLFAALAAVFAFALKTGDPSKLPSALIGKRAPALLLMPLEGLTADGVGAVPGIGEAHIQQGRPIVVNFWASWCGPCVDEHPLLMALKARHGATILGVNYKDQPAAARRFLGRYGNPFDAVGVDGNGRAAIEWGVYGMPETFVLNGKGEIVHKHVGPLTETAIATKILPALKAAGAK